MTAGCYCLYKLNNTYLQTFNNISDSYCSESDHGCLETCGIALQLKVAWKTLWNISICNPFPRLAICFFLTQGDYHPISYSSLKYVKFSF